jgi:hypothetical protein
MKKASDSAKDLAKKKAGKNRTDKYGESGFGQSKAGTREFVKPGYKGAYAGGTDAEEAGYGIPNDPNFKKYDKFVRGANTRANKNMVSQSVTGYTPQESTMVEDNGSRSVLFGRDVKQYNADNKGVSASRGREIKAKAKENMIDYGGGPIEATQRAIRDVNRMGNDSIITPGKISRKGEDKAYREALASTAKQYVPTKEAKAERARLKKSRQRTGGGGSAASRIGDNG